MAASPPAYSDGEGDAPPSYSECVEQQQAQVQLNTTEQNNTRVAAVQERIRVYHYTSEVTICDFLESPLRAIHSEMNLINSIKGLVGVLHDQPKLRWKFRRQMAYKLNLVLYYFINFVYLVVACAAQKENISYYITFVILSFLGFVCATSEILHYQYRVWSRNQQQLLDAANNTTPREAWAETQTSPNSLISMPFRKKAKAVLMKYVLSSLGEFLILPSLICSLFRFINEKSWTFDNEIARCNFHLMVYSIGMDTLYIKLYFLWLVRKVIKMSYNKYYQLLDESNDSGTESCRCCSPVHMAVFFTALTIFLQWTMYTIIGIRIYVDNFVSQTVSTTKGNYTSSPYTRFMISSCGIHNGYHLDVVLHSLHCWNIATRL